MAKSANISSNMNEKGFTVVELMITLFVAAAVFAIIASTYTSAGRLADRSEDLLTANSIAYKKLQEYENRRFADIADTKPNAPDPDAEPEEVFTSSLPGSLPGPKTGEVFVSKVNDSNTLTYVFVRVTYQSVSGKQVLEYGTLIQAGGLGR